MNLRAGASTDTGVVAVLPAGTEISLTGNVSGGFAEGRHTLDTASAGSTPTTSATARQSRPSRPRIALALGATHGQGWLFGRPEALPQRPAAPVRPLPATRPVIPLAPGDTPFGIVSAQRPTRRGSKRLLLAISKHLEAQAMAHGEAAVVFATFQEGAT